MTKVRFLEDFDYKPTRASTIGYTAGMVLTVKRDCARKAIAAKKAVLVSSRSQQEGLSDDASKIVR